MLSGAISHGTLGHAYLLCGDVGTGTFQAALELSMALLCSSDGEVPCYACEACKKVLRNAHPDFHVIMPVTLEKEYKDSDNNLNQEGWEFLSSTIRARIAEPYCMPVQTGIPAIPVEWVKEINHAISRGAVLQGTTIAIFDGIDIMNKESANAMLATLEDPPENTVMLLMTQRPQAVLPTIASRCQMLRFGCLPEADIRNILLSRYGDAVSGTIIDEAVNFSLGSLGRAMDLCERPLGELAEESRLLLKECFDGDWLRIAPHLDALARRGNDDRHEKLFMHLASLFRKELLGNVLPGKPPAAECDKVTGFSFADNPERAAGFLKACQIAIDGIRAHGNMSILLVNFIITFMEMIREQKQQIS
jgi:hypothetical protein